MLTATLYINRSDSRCGACNRGADPRETGHFTRLGWNVRQSNSGCHALFVAVSSDYLLDEDFIAAIRRLQPDLPLVSRGVRPTD